MLNLARSTDLRANHECGCLLEALQMNHSSATPCLYSDVLFSVWLQKWLFSSCEYPKFNKDLDLFPCVATKAFSVLAHLLDAANAMRATHRPPTKSLREPICFSDSKKLGYLGAELLSLVTNTPSYLVSQVHVVFIKVIFLKSQSKQDKSTPSPIQWWFWSEEKAHNIKLASMQKLDTDSEAEEFWNDAKLHFHLVSTYCTNDHLVICTFRLSGLESE